jgi:hypothetical protein
MPTRARRMRRKASMCKFGSKKTSVWNRWFPRKRCLCWLLVSAKKMPVFRFLMQIIQRIHENVSLRGRNFKECPDIEEISNTCRAQHSVTKELFVHVM